ncbi:zinc ABC transporter substrate-binding protein AztC [Aeromicrobium sp. CTD01-1L150]|uniref:zinc ABC transporter substrate-binding protein AztC n=1 Tax=Aeromicrobium sp. CTD01-1L150 TaxID=3341830 RepID=UPI0035C07992
MVTRRIAATIAALTLGAGLLGGCGAQSAEDGGIVVTTNILGDVVQEVVGDEVPVTVLMAPNADPHSFEISARQAATVERASLIVSNGLGLEEGVQTVVDAAQDSGVAVLPVAEEVRPLTYREGASAGQDDPHFWTDPARVREAVDLIEEQVLEHVEAVDADQLRASAAEYAEQIDELDAWMETELASVPEERRSLVTNHHVLGYLADRFGYEVIGAVIPSGTTLASPSASDLDSLSTAVREAGVRTVFADSSQPDKLARVMAEQADLDVEVADLYSESLTAEDEASTYLSMMRANTETIVAGLRG